MPHSYADDSDVFGYATNDGASYLDAQQALNSGIDDDREKVTNNSCGLLGDV